MDTLYRVGLPPEELRRSVPLWQARLLPPAGLPFIGWFKVDQRPFIIWFTVDEHRLPREVAHSPAAMVSLEAEVWTQMECRPLDENGTPIPWEE